MARYNVKKPAVQGVSEVNPVTSSMQVAHRGKTVEVVLDDMTQEHSVKNILTFTSVEQFGAGTDDAPGILIEKLPPDAVAMLPADVLTNTEWNFPEEEGSLEIRKGRAKCGQAGSTKLSVRYIADAEWTLSGNVWRKCLSGNGIGERTTDTVTNVTIATDTETTLMSRTFGKGLYIANVSLQYAAKSGGVRRLWLSIAEGAFGYAELKNKQLLPASGYVCILGVTTILRLTAETTMYVRTSHNAGEDLNVSQAEFNCIKIADID